MIVEITSATMYKIGGLWASGMEKNSFKSEYSWFVGSLKGEALKGTG